MHKSNQLLGILASPYQDQVSSRAHKAQHVTINVITGKIHRNAIQHCDSTTLHTTAQTTWPENETFSSLNNFSRLPILMP